MSGILAVGTSIHPIPYVGLVPIPAVVACLSSLLVLVVLVLLVLVLLVLVLLVLVLLVPVLLVLELFASEEQSAGV